jgi:hypothetical protein
VATSHYSHLRTVTVFDDGIFIENDSSEVAYPWILGQGDVCAEGLVPFHANSGWQLEQVSRFDFHGFKVKG